MTKPTSEFGKEAFDNGLKSIAAVSKGAQAIAMETSEYLKKSVEDGAALLQDVAKAGSVEKALEIQSKYAKSTYESFVAETSKLTQLYADLARDAFKPYEAAFAKVK